ncbi:MAG: response regulator [Verrucomicrobiota bacterium]|nr:response regulator [Verrucomicrobiota bacterium]
MNLYKKDKIDEKKTVLIIDDDKNIVKLLSVFLITNKMIPISAYSAEEGMVVTRTKKLHLILLDIVLPELNGVAALKSIKKYAPSVPIIMITGHDDIEVAKKCLENGACDYITKPFDSEYLRTSILANSL